MDDFFDQIDQPENHSPQNQDQAMQDSTNFGYQPQTQAENQESQKKNYDDFFENKEEQNSAFNQQNQTNEQYNNFNQFPQEQQIDYQQNAYSEQIPENKEEDILQQLEKERNQKLIESQIQESKKQEEILDNAKNWIQNWRSERQKQIEAKQKINRENEIALLEAQEKNIQYKTEWDKVVHNIELKKSESSNGKEILRMKQAILGKNSDLSHQNQ